MPDFLLVYHGGGMPDSPEEGGKIMEAWMKWFGDLGDAVLDPGNPVAHSKTISVGGVTDGGGANPASGFSKVRAESMEAAVEIAKGCPVLQGGATIEVCETFNPM
jgi:hypothetical protein